MSDDQSTPNDSQGVNTMSILVKTAKEKETIQVQEDATVQEVTCLLILNEPITNECNNS